MNKKPSFEEIELAKTNWKNYSIRQLRVGLFIIELLVDGQWIEVGKRQYNVAEAARGDAWKMFDDQKHKYDAVRKHPDDIVYTYMQGKGKHKWPNTRDIR